MLGLLPPARLSPPHLPPGDPVVVLPMCSLKSEVVYECPECEARYLGIQRCEDAMSSPGE